MKNKRIFSITISDEDRYVYIKDYPVIYESEKEIVFLISYGTSKTIYKSNCFYDSLSDDKIIDIFKSKETSHLYCTTLETKLSGRNLYIKSREAKIINELTWKEELVFTMREQNFTIEEISQVTDNCIKTVYNIINRIRKKVSSIVSNKNNY